MACLALQHEVGHELHLDGDDAGTLALVAASAVGIEREVLRCEAHLLCQWLLGEEVANGVVGLDVGGRVRASALAYGVLVNELHPAQRVDVALQSAELTGSVAHITLQSLQCGVEYSLDEC